MFGLTMDDFVPHVEEIISVGELYEKAAGGQIIFTWRYLTSPASSGRPGIRPCHTASGVASREGLVDPDRVQHA